MINLEAALAFLAESPRSVDRAWGTFSAGRGERAAVVAALTEYQNPDGGFGRNLEIDIKAPDSNPFAVRLAMIVMSSTGITSDEPIVQPLRDWLEREQGEDGCWRLEPGLYEHELAPWFQGWEFPSLNPALCLAGFATRLGIAAPAVISRVETLARSMASQSQVRDGEFYDVLPYAEFVPWLPHVLPPAFLDALIDGIAHRLATGGYHDAGHAFDHIGPASGPVARRLPPDSITATLDRLEEEQAPDGGWPSPYDPLWRSWATSSALAILRDFGRLAS